MEAGECELRSCNGRQLGDQHREAGRGAARRRRRSAQRFQNTGHGEPPCVRVCVRAREPV